MVTIVEFITARLDDEKRLAKAAGGPDEWGESWRVAEPRNGQIFVGDRDDIPVASCRAVGWSHDPCEPLDEDQAEHIAAQDPARTLRRVEALRAIVSSNTWGGPDHSDKYDEHMQMLANAWSDHPDFQPEWSLT